MKQYRASVHSWIENRRRSEQKKLVESEVTLILTQLVDTFVYLHSKDVVHRDLNPSNVFLDELGNIKLENFGLAFYESKGKEE